MRKSVLMKLKNLSADDYRAMSERIYIRLIETSDFKKANTVALTISRKTEVDTRKIIEICWEIGKKVVVPKCNPKTKTMDFREISSFNQLETVYLDLQEPDPLKTTSIEAKEIDLLIVPGVVFSDEGYRIGYGGGYYDRFLVIYTGVTASLAFNMQLVSQIPVEVHDLPVDRIITEERVIECEIQD